MTQFFQGSAAGLPANIRGAADPNFSWAVRAFAAAFPGRRFGGGALAVYLDGKPVVDVWTGWADRAGRVPWSADTGAMVFSATKGAASTVIHRLVDRGLIDYDMPVARYWPEFAARGKAAITVRELMGHRAGLTHLNGVSRADLLDHRAMEARMAAAAPGPERGKPAYHALTYGWLLSGLARGVTGMSMRELFRSELAGPLGIDGLHLGRPPVDAPTRAAEIIMPQRSRSNRVVNLLAPKAAALLPYGGFGAIYFPGVMDAVRGDIPLLDTEAAAVNGVATARGLARLYGALANGGQIDGTQLLSRRIVDGLSGRRSLQLDRTVVIPLAFHLGYHAVPFGSALPGYGHVGLGGSMGWADPASGLAIGFVHNRLLTPFIGVDHGGFVATAALIRRGAAQARRKGYTPVPQLGEPFAQRDAATG
ncbi:serine hydrolase domain-containing protein [Mycolicibacter hiberniae]|uniref:Esterase n=1 Tax=Mycolicibacter hiberniae TaxID=29314 RepID=A0A7I7X078_9MYCO|nr:serine hydrolase domain-containing protein [Mycolicibacter hiberniae]MCV7084911.1 beta-lactamase family protein [Mycolicibacter hiberniae]ORV71531.1 esterase [Mycolicibacter hiberniae]BBZ23249.1 esterase [Mycolicibacter hiberniae]